MDFAALYSMLFDKMGDLGWWPADTSDEVVIGTILTQNTSWKNVEKALSELRKAGLLSLDGISRVKEEELSALIRSSGFHNQKAQRLSNLSGMILSEFGDLESMASRSTPEIVNFLSPIKGIGQETLDSIMLYALGKPVFIMANYTERIFSRLGILGKNDAAIDLKNKVPAGLNYDIGKLKNFHGMLVELAKQHCRKKPVCNGCPLSDSCRHYKEIMLP